MSRRVPFTGAEKESLRASLDRQRDAVVWKMEGLGDADLRRPMTPSGTNLLGLGATPYGDRSSLDAPSAAPRCPSKTFPHGSPLGKEGCVLSSGKCPPAAA